MEKCRIYATAYNPFIYVKDKQLKGTDPETKRFGCIPYFLDSFVFGVNFNFLTFYIGDIYNEKIYSEKLTLYSVALAAVSFSSCSLEENNPAGFTKENLATSIEGYENVG